MEVVVALLALLTLANIGLTVAVIKRLAAHERKLSEFTTKVSLQTRKCAVR